MNLANSSAVVGRLDAINQPIIVNSAAARAAEFSALLVDDELRAPTAGGRAIRDIADAIRAHGGAVVEATSFEDGRAAFVMNPGVDVIVVDWDLGEDDGIVHSGELLKR